uniref:Uncharacterized protein n=1 Tax=Anguilla anguilla TaxID=7936 RepID=A0A0E9WH26_ANGAN
MAHKNQTQYDAEHPPRVVPARTLTGGAVTERRTESWKVAAMTSQVYYIKEMITGMRPVIAD